MTSDKYFQAVLTDLPVMHSSARRKTLELFFENFQSPAVCLVDPAVMSLYAHGLTTGVVVDIGDHLEVRQCSREKITFSVRLSSCLLLLIIISYVFFFHVVYYDFSAQISPIVDGHKIAEATYRDRRLLTGESVTQTLARLLTERGYYYNNRPDLLRHVG